MTEPRGFLFPLVMILGLAGYLVVSGQFRTTEPSVLRAETTLTYCSAAEAVDCQPGVATVDVLAATRNRWFTDLYEYEVPTTVNVKLQSLDIKLGAGWELWFAEDERLLIAADSDGSGTWSASDEVLAEGLLKGRHLVFEGLNMNLGPESVVLQGEVGVRLFVVRPDREFANGQVEVEGELETVRVFSNIDTEILDLDASRERIPDRGSVVDVSWFKYHDRVLESFAQAAARYPWMHHDEEADTLTIGPGSIEVREDVIIPAGGHVVVAAGTTLTLAPGRSLVTYSPLTMDGTSASPITVAPLEGEPFGVIGFIGDTAGTADVRLSHVHVTGGSDAVISGAYLSGMVSIYRAGRVIVEDSDFGFGYADDALNIKYGEIELRGSSFGETSADAFDGDFVTGVISANTFHDIGNDAVDFSGSDVHVIGNVVNGAGDKCVSAGEATTVVVEANRLIDCATGVAIKDASQATVRENVFVDASLVNIDIFQKKSFFGQPTGHVEMNGFIGTAPMTSGLLDRLTVGENAVGTDVEQMLETQSWLADVIGGVPGE